jgi:integrase/recombinase XerD
MRRVTFKSVLAPFLRDFVALRRACGSDFSGPEFCLGKFDRFLSSRKARAVDARVLRDFVASLGTLSGSYRTHIVGFLWGALEHAHRHGGPVREIPDRPQFKKQSPRKPYILSEVEVARLLAATRLVGTWHPRYAVTGPTQATLFGLLRATGIRISEALALNVCDLEREDRLLVIRAGKFKKARLVPLSSSTMNALTRYLDVRTRLGHTPVPDGSFFVSHFGSRLAYRSAHHAFSVLVRLAGISDAQGRRPRVHDLRHTFAVRAVIDWHEKGRDANRLLALLSTYMGHVDLASTTFYLQPSPELLLAAGRRFESACASALRVREGGLL